MKNLELKAELRDPNLARLICKQLKASRVGVIRQTDTYFNVMRGRLKRRESVVVERGVGSPEPIEYIFYERPDRIGARVSDYHIYTQEQVRERFGEQPLPVWLEVVKKRELYLYDSTRIHIDDVHDLGWYFEYEIILEERPNMEKVNDLADRLRATFLPALGEPIASSYADLIAQANGLRADRAEEA